MFKALFSKFKTPSVPAAPVQASAPEISPEVRLQLLAEATAALHAGQYDAVHERTQPLLWANPEDVNALTLEGFRFYQLGDMAASAAVLTQAVEALGLRDPMAVKVLASALSRTGDAAAALRWAEESVALLPTDPQALQMLGALYFDAMRFADAARMLNRALVQASGDFQLDILCDMVHLDTRGGSVLQAPALDHTGQTIKQDAVRFVLAACQAGRATVQQVKALFIFAQQSGGELFAAASQTAAILFKEPFIDGKLALLIGRQFSIEGKLDEAIEMLEQDSRQQEGPDQYLLGALLVAQGERWAEGWQCMDEGFARAYSLANEGLGIKRWQGERIGRKRLFIYQDQGAGDMLIAMRLLPLLAQRGIQAVMSVTPGVADLLRSADCGIEIHESETPASAEGLGCEYVVPIFGLIRALKLSQADLARPLLAQASPARCADWRARLLAERRPRIGIAATGNPWRVDDWHRSVPATALQPLQALPDICWVNLAADSRPEQAATIALLDALNPMPDTTCFADTLAIIDTLDCVIAIDCVVAHLAAALGKPVFVLASSAIDWRWQIGTARSPWWPTAQTFRAPAPGDWRESVEQLLGAVQGFLADRGAGAS